MKTVRIFFVAASLVLLVASPAVAQSSDNILTAEESPGWVYVASAIAIVVGGLAVAIQISRAKAAKKREA
jgi:hypothetical protein